jgi:unsaturated rhamnogalacturonyl hydrolase
MSPHPTRRLLLASGGALAMTAVLGPTNAVAAPPPRTRRTDVIAALRTAADYWMGHPQDDNNDNNWQNATFHSGNMALWRLVGDPTYREFTLAWAEAHDFQLMADTASRPFFADHETAGQVYLDLYESDPQPHYTAATVARFDAQLASGRADYWTWVDALHMALPGLVRYSALPGKGAYRDYAYRGYQFTRTQDGGPGLFDPAAGLWWRDANFVHTGTYWSRGVGWAVAAQVKAAAALPPGHPHRAVYTANLRRVLTALLPLQRADGFWNAGLTDPAHYAGPETSGTAFFTYGLAWGIRNGVLGTATYGPALRRAWQALTGTALQPGGLLGYVQGPGAKPSDGYPWGPTTTASYGVGAFLLAGSEVANMVRT